MIAAAGFVLLLAAVGVVGPVLLVLCLMTEAAELRRVQTQERDELGLDR